MKVIGKAFLIGMMLIAASLVVLATPAYAQTQTLSGTNVTDITISSGETYTVTSGTTLVNDGTMTVDGTLVNDGTIYDQGAITVDSGGTFSNQGTLFLNDSSALTVDTGSIFTSTGVTYYVLNPSTSSYVLGGIHGVWTGSTFAVDSSGATFTGIFTGYTAALYIPLGTTVTIDTYHFSPLTVDISGTVYNYGTMTVFYQSAAHQGLLNKGTFINYGTMTLGGASPPTRAGTDIVNTGTFNNYGSITYEPYGGTGISNKNTGTFNNYGNLTVSGDIQYELTNGGTFNNENTGTITITDINYNGDVKGFVDNAILNNYGTIIITSTGQLWDYYGNKIVNEEGASIYLYNKGGIQIAGSTMDNSGTIYLVLDMSTFDSLWSGYGVWNGDSLTGTLTSPGAHFTGTEISEFTVILYIPLDVTLVISNSGGIGLTDSGTIDNYGIVDVQNTGGTGISVSSNVDPLSNEAPGTINVYNSAGIGIDVSGTLDNSGTVEIGSSAGVGVNIAGSIDNTGTINVHNSGGTGIYVASTGTVTNEGTGTINVHNDAGTGIDNYGTLDNGGTINVQKGALLINELGATITNEPGSNFHIDKKGTVDNYGTMTNEPGSQFTDHGTLN